jgi:type IV pilus assembly protein PilP
VRLSYLFLILSGLGLSACSGDGFDDLKQFVNQSGEGLRGKIEPLPEIKAYESFAYNAFDLPDPFKPRKLQPGQGGGLQPDLKRNKEELEKYPLENLKMVGFLEQNKVRFGLIKTSDGTLHRVKIGEHMGQNFGMITKITDKEIVMTEIVQDSTGNWTEQNTSINLASAPGQK